MSAVILGAGVSGLSAAFYLLKHTTYKVTILEANPRIGGWILSQLDPNGFIFEQAARTLRPIGEAGLNTLKLIEDLNLSDNINPVTAAHPLVKNRFIYIQGNLHALPTSTLSLFVTKPPFSKPLISAVWNDLFAAPNFAEDDTIYNFTKRRFGQEVADYVISPLVCGICAGNAKEISVKLLFNTLYENEQKYGSVVKGFLKEFRKKATKDTQVVGGILPMKALMEKWLLYTLKGGLYSLPQELATYVEQNGGTISLNSTCTEINFSEKSVTTSDNQKLKFDCLISSLPASKLAPLLKKEQKYISNELENIPYVSVATVNLAYKGKLLKEEGFGFLVPPSENLPLLGVTFDSSVNNNDEWTILTAMMGGYAFEKHFGNNPTEQTLLDTATKYVRSILGISAEPISYKVSVLLNCIPQYVVGHKARVNNIFKNIEDNKLPLSLIGNSYNGIGINDVILSARKAVSKLAVYS